MNYRSSSAEQTAELGAELASRLSAGTVVALHGALGSGKSVFARGVVKALGVQEPVTSPTFTIVNEYGSDPPVLHIDLYRISGADEFLLLGIDERFDQCITLVEWPERAHDAMESPDFSVEIAVTAETTRLITIIPDPGLLQ